MLFINDKCLLLLISVLTLTSAFNVFVVPDQEEDELKSTDMPTEAIPTSTEDLSEFEDITLDVGEYTTIIYQYENEQNMGLHNPKDRCYEDYTQCLTSMISALRPVCAYHSQYTSPKQIRTFRSTCDMYLNNCLQEHRHWRVLDYGKCVDTVPYTVWRPNYPFMYKNFGVVNTK